MRKAVGYIVIFVSVSLSLFFGFLPEEEEEAEEKEEEEVEEVEEDVG
jgi:hypothetical protein